MFQGKCQSNNASKYQGNNAKMYQGRNVRMYPESNATMYLVNNVIMYPDRCVKAFQGELKIKFAEIFQGKFVTTYLGKCQDRSAEMSPASSVKMFPVKFNV